jgi:hypothetical protein|tara:strand:+ start:320 stop:463 length:144 start_codon:yes stop_codon:yes gene_type:complete
MPYILLKIFWWFDDIISLFKQYIFIWMYKRHLKKRIKKNDFGRRPEY